MYQIYKAVCDWYFKLEVHLRGYLSRHPIFYAFIDAVGIVIFWRGVWHTADFIMGYWASSSLGISGVDVNLGLWWDGPLSILVGAGLLLVSGVFVSNFIGNEIIISGIKGEKKLAQKTEKEVRTEENRLVNVRQQVSVMHAQMADLKTELDQLLQNQQAPKA